MRNIDFTDSINAVIQGDMDAFEYLYNQTYSYLRLKVSQYLKKEEDIEDVLQNTYLKIYSELSNLKEPKSFWKWAGTIATHTALTEIQCQRALKNSKTDLFPSTIGSFEKEDKNRPIEAMDEIAAETYYAEFNPEANIDAKETKRLIDEMLADLPEMQRQCITLWQEQCSTKEIAEKLAIPLGTVKTHIFQAKKKIKVNVLELEKKGTKLYGMAPIPFFLWVFKLFDTSYADTLPAQGDAALYEQIVSNIRVSAATDTPGNTVMNESSSISRTSGTSDLSLIATKTGTHRILFKTMLSVASIAILGIGGVSIYQTAHTPATNDSKVMEQDKDKKPETDKNSKPSKEEISDNSSKTTNKPAEEQKTKLPADNTGSNDNQQSHTHSWVQQYTTVYHEEVGHSEQVWVVDAQAWDEPVYEGHYICNKCGADLGTGDPTAHSIECRSGYHTENVQVGTTHHDEVGHYESKWVVDSQAWTETVPNGYSCSGCGATK